MFDRWDGRPWDPNEMSRHFTRLVRRKKLPALRFHDLRHSYASMVFDAGVPLAIVSRSLGHSTVGITDAIYLHPGDGATREKATKHDAYVSPYLEAPAGKLG